MPRSQPRSRPQLAAAPSGPVTIPLPVRDLARGALITPVWENSLGGLTFSIAAHGPDPARFTKWVAAGTPELDLVAEAERLRWARAAGARAPEVLAYAATDAGSWLVTRAIDAQSAVSARWRDSPRTAARAIGEGLRELHTRLDPASCPFSWSLEHRIAQAEARLRSGDGPGDWSPEHRGHSVDEAFRILADPPPLDGPVVCHGDACAPNTLLTRHGAFAAHVDFGALGVADRWADLAIAAWSTEWNYGPGFDAEVYAGYGVAPDPDRIAYYRLLWDLS